MSNDNTENKNPKERGMSDSDKGYYEDLYNDLPKEVVDILMQTHPLMGNKDAEAQTYRSRRPAREDVEQIKEARMQRVGSEINEIRQAPQQEGEPTRYVSRRARSAGEEMASPSAGRSDSQEQDDYDDGIQYVSMMPAKRKSRIVEEVTLQTASAPNKKKVKREDNPFEDLSGGKRPRYEDIDFEEKAKQENLDSLYDDDYDDDYGGGRSNKLVIGLGAVAVILLVVLIFKCVGLSSELEEAKNELTSLTDVNTKYQAIQLEKLQLEEELSALKNPDVAQGGADSDTVDTSDSGGSTTTDPSTSASTKEYTVASGDTIWTIAEKIYGNGSQYQKILDANGLKEGETLKIGTKLKIPQE